MKTRLHLIPLLLLGGSVAAQEAAPSAPAAARNPAALEILQKVDRAAKSVDSVRYSATMTPSGVATSFAAPAEGESVAEGWIGGGPARFRTRVKTARPGTDGVVELTGGGNGEVFYLIDHQAKKAWRDMDPAVMGRTGRAVQGFGMAEFLHPTPFDDELNADAIELLEAAEVAGEPCDQVRVVYGGGQGESIWFFSKKDSLPRRRIQKFTIPGQGDGSIERTITKLEANPELDPKLFAFELPEGYELIDDFAP